MKTLTKAARPRLAVALMALPLSLVHQGARAEERVFDELRFGSSTSIGADASHEPALFASATVYFDPFSETEAPDWKQVILEPRLYLGTSMATEDGVNQLYGGLSWDVDVTDRFFLELGVGGSAHDGDLDTGAQGLQLGCRFLFREYAAAGYRLDDNWQVLATIDHASHANLCEGPDDGLSHAGLAIGYTF